MMDVHFKYIGIHQHVRFPEFAGQMDVPRMGAHIVLDGRHYVVRSQHWYPKDPKVVCGLVAQTEDDLS